MTKLIQDRIKAFEIALNNLVQVYHSEYEKKYYYMIEHNTYDLKVKDLYNDNLSQHINIIENYYKSKINENIRENKMLLNAGLSKLQIKKYNTRGWNWDLSYDERKELIKDYKYISGDGAGGYNEFGFYGDFNYSIYKNDSKYIIIYKDYLEGAGTDIGVKIIE